MPNVTKATISMGVSTSRKDGTPLARQDLRHIRVYRQGASDTTGVLIATLDQPVAGGFPDVVSYDDATIESGKPYDYWFTEVDENGDEGDPSNHWPVVVPVPEAAPSAGTITGIVFS